MSDIFEAARLISEWDNILVLSHASPDGDTLGSATALLRGLISLGKKVAFKCADDIGHKYSYLFRIRKVSQLVHTDPFSCTDKKENK